MTGLHITREQFALISITIPALILAMVGYGVNAAAYRRATADTVAIAEPFPVHILLAVGLAVIVGSGLLSEYRRRFE